MLGLSDASHDRGRHSVRHPRAEALSDQRAKVSAPMAFVKSPESWDIPTKLFVPENTAQRNRSVSSGKTRGSSPPSAPRPRRRWPGQREDGNRDALV